MIDLKEMAKSFGIKLEEIENEIADLIATGNINAKIDSHSKVLYAKQDNEKIQSFKKGVELGKTFIRETQNLLLRIKLNKEKKVLLPPKKDKQFY